MINRLIILCVMMIDIPTALILNMIKFGLGLLFIACII